MAPNNDPSLVHHEPGTGPRTHVLLVGVGRYPHLLGGAGPLLQEHQGLGQLTSPPVSARALARWFAAQFHNRRRPLASVRLLLSEESPTPFVHPKTAAETDVPVATMANVEAAWNAWVADGDTDPDNLLIFYFCGHGLSSGLYPSLLLEDFGANPNNALRGAIDFDRTRLGMSRCKADDQLYLIDACRTQADATRYAADAAGQVLLVPKTKGATARRSVLHSTMFGQPAHGRSGKPSHFAEAVLAALDGAGGHWQDGAWRVQTSTLHRAIEAQLKRKVRGGLASAQVPSAQDLVTFDVHELRRRPSVPVFVSCAPPGALSSARFRFLENGSVVAERTIAEDQPWQAALAPGSYELEALFDPGTYPPPAPSEQYVWPPELDVLVEVEG